MRFPIGTQYHSSGKHPIVCTVVDYHVTRNLAGEVVKSRYMTSHGFLSQVIFEYDVCDTAIARRLLPAFKHLLKE